MSETPLMAVRHLSKRFEVGGGWFGRARTQVKAVDDVSFDIAPGETLALVGESGCGKTTTGRALLRLIEPTAGEIRYRGEDFMAMRGEALQRARRELQIVFQDPYASLNPRITVGNAIGEAVRVHGLARGRELHARVNDILERVGLSPDVSDRYPHEFSGGQRQRIGIARALVLRPRLIVCDEAVSALDVSIQAQIINLLRDLQQEFGLAYLFISHDLNVVRHIAERVAVMYLGRIVEDAPAASLFENPRHPYTRALLAANPVPDPACAERPTLLPGDAPSPLSPPPGCAFHPRCALAIGECPNETPLEREPAPGWRVRCHLYNAAPQSVAAP